MRMSEVITSMRTCLPQVEEAFAEADAPLRRAFALVRDAHECRSAEASKMLLLGSDEAVTEALWRFSVAREKLAAAASAVKSYTRVFEPSEKSSEEDPRQMELDLSEHGAPAEQGENHEERREEGVQVHGVQVREDGEGGEGC